MRMKRTRMLTVAPVWGNTRKHIGCVSPRSRARQAEADETMLRLRAASQQAYHHNRMLQFFALRQPVPQYMRLTRHNLGNHFYQVDEMFRLDTALHLSPLLLPTKYRTSARDSVNCVEGLCIVLRHFLRAGKTWCLSLAGLRPLCRIFIHTMQLILDRHGTLLDFNPLHFLHRLPECAAAVASFGIDESSNIALFIDGTLRGCTIPSPKAIVLPPGVTAWQLQAALFSGHKWTHGLKSRV